MAVYLARSCPRCRNYFGRAGTNTAYWWGKEMKPSMAKYNERGTLWGPTHRSLPVGSFQPNPFGLYDTAGNVWEWVQDHWHLNYDGAPTDGSEWFNKIGVSARRLYERRVFRGGSFGSIPKELRSSQRNWSPPDGRSNSLGFRLVRALD
jgi:formylglycine-generating enzyme required for sulfatase activity